jgi:CDP-glucose 4,6-dehydratase
MSMNLSNTTPLFGGFFCGKRVLVTGAVGVKATWLCHMLHAAGAAVTGLDLKLPEPSSNFALSGLPRCLRFVQGDVTDLKLMRELLGENDCLFHLAALALVHECRMQPLEAYRANTLGTATVAEAYRLSPTARYAVFITTDKVYAPKQNGLWVEGDPLFASGPYAVSKACAEQILADYRSYLEPLGKRYGVGRAGNVLVGGDLHSTSRNPGAGRIFVDCYEALIAGRPPEIFSPSFTRPFTYGLDVIAGYMSLMARLEDPGIHGEAFNFGPHEQGGIPNGLLATKICEQWGEGIMWQGGKLRAEPFETQALCWEKSRQRLGWLPAFTLYEGIQNTARWYREWARVHHSPTEGALSTLNLELIRDHQESARRLGVWWATGETKHAGSS